MRSKMHGILALTLIFSGVIVLKPINAYATALESLEVLAGAADERVVFTPAAQPLNAPARTLSADSVVIVYAPEDDGNEAFNGVLSNSSFQDFTAALNRKGLPLVLVPVMRSYFNGSATMFDEDPEHVNPNHASIENAILNYLRGWTRGPGYQRPIMIFMTHGTLETVNGRTDTSLKLAGIRIRMSKLVERVIRPNNVPAFTLLACHAATDATRSAADLVVFGSSAERMGNSGYQWRYFKAWERIIDSPSPAPASRILREEMAAGQAADPLFAESTSNDQNVPQPMVHSSAEDVMLNISGTGYSLKLVANGAMRTGANTCSVTSTAVTPPMNATVTMLPYQRKPGLAGIQLVRNGLGLLGEANDFPWIVNFRFQCLETGNFSLSSQSLDEIQHVSAYGPSPAHQTFDPATCRLNFRNVPADTPGHRYLRGENVLIPGFQSACSGLMRALASGDSLITPLRNTFKIYYKCSVRLPPANPGDKPISSNPSSGECVASNDGRACIGGVVVSDIDQCR